MSIPRRHLTRLAVATLVAGPVGTAVASAAPSQDAAETPASLAEWMSEVIAFPPGFAPELPPGIESLRFAPGWRDPDGATFWSYALAIWIDEPTPDAARLDELLELYYDGLIAAVGEGKQRDEALPWNPDDPADIIVTRTGPNRFSATMEFLNAFGDFEPVAATARIHAVSTTSGGAVLRMQVSTRPDGDEVWSHLAAAVASTPRPEGEAAPNVDPFAPPIVDPLVAWNAAAAAVRDSGRYGAFELRPQMGLVPLGADPDSGLQEFLHLATHVGPVPTRNASGRIPVTQELGLVFVLVPPGQDWLGSQAGDLGTPNYDPMSQPNETLREVTFAAPYLLSKYEMTQGQWARSAADELTPSEHTSGEVRDGQPVSRLGTTVDLRHPVESISWEMTTANLARMGLRLPSEDEWEYAARAGTSAPWGGGAEDVASLPAWGNLPGLDDGYHRHAPVGRYRPNAFGLHDTLGNAWEWAATPRINRGGSHVSGLHFARVAFTGGRGENARGNALGVRPARSFDDT